MISFEITCKQIIITDPCYSVDSGCNYIANVDELWEGMISYHNEKPKELEVWSISNPYRGEYSEWVKVGDICVDSGIVGFYDMHHFQNNSIIDSVDLFYEDGVDKLLPEHKWFSANYGVANTKQMGGSIPFGCVVKTPYMNGCYDLYMQKKDDKINAFKLVLFD